MSKRHKKSTTPNLAPATVLRARLEAQWRDPAASPTLAQVEAALQAAGRGLKPETVVSVVLALYPTAPASIQAALDGLMPVWLAQQNYLAGLASQVGEGRLLAALQPIAQHWLAAAGQVVRSPAADPDGGFHSAYALDDGSQAAVTLFWYSNPHHNRLSGLQFLIDHNPPWNGAIKDVFQFPSKPLPTLLKRYVQMWAERGNPMDPIDAAAVKRKLLQALLANWEANIRLPKDLIALREQFFQHVLTLPDLPDTPAFTVDQFHALSQLGQSPEALSQFEHTVGRRILMEDGQELFIDAQIANQGLDDWDDDPA